MADKDKRYSYQIHCAEAMTDERLVRDTVVTVLARSLPEAIARAKQLLGQEAASKTKWWPGSILDLDAVVK